MSNSEDHTALEIPTAGWADRIRTLILGGVGSIPLAGQAASALVELLWQPAYEKRVQVFLEQLVKNLQILGGRVANLEILIEREAAISMGIAGARAAGRTHDNAKLRYLANAVAWVTADRAWDGQIDFATVLLQFVDELTATHIQVLALAADPEKWDAQLSPENYSHDDALQILKTAFPNVDTFIMNTIASDLIAKGLIHPQHNFFGGASLSRQGASELGRRLLDLIKEIPSEDKPL